MTYAILDTPAIHGTPVGGAARVLTGTMRDLGSSAVTDLLACPDAEIDTALRRVREVADLLDTILQVRSRSAGELGSWAGAKRVEWEEQFGFSQGDGAVALDDMQALIVAIEAVRTSIVEENARRVLAALLPGRESPAGTGGGGSW